LTEVAVKAALTLTLILLSATAGLAEPVTAKAAKKLLFAPKGGTVEMRPGTGLSEQDQTVLATVAAQQPYYGAIAISPDEGMLSEATVAAANYHDTTSAEAAVLAECDAKKTGTTPCVIAALIRPEGYEVRPLQLSLDATVAFREDFPRNGALAISATTGAWGIGADAEAAVTACAKDTVADCTAVIVD
jgi:hypothetical protein